MGSYGNVVQLPWKITLSNTGNRQLSVTEYGITRGDSPESIQYSGIDGGLVSNKSEPIVLPITLAAGESRTFYILVGITVSQDAYETLASISETPVTDRTATKKLAAKGIDYYGNEVEYTEYEDGSFHFAVSDVQKAQRFWIRFETGQGNAFYASAMKYEGLK